MQTHDRLRKKALNFRKETVWANYCKHRNKFNNMKKHAFPNYYECIDFDISDVSTNNNKLYWKLQGTRYGY